MSILPSLTTGPHGSTRHNEQRLGPSTLAKNGDLDWPPVGTFSWPPTTAAGRDSRSGRLSIAPACNVARTSLDHAARVFDIDAWRIDQCFRQAAGSMTPRSAPFEKLMQRAGDHQPQPRTRLMNSKRGARRATTERPLPQ